MYLSVKDKEVDVFKCWVEVDVAKESGCLWYYVWVQYRKPDVYYLDFENAVYYASGSVEEAFKVARPIKELISSEQEELYKRVSEIIWSEVDGTCEEVNTPSPGAC